MNNINIVDRVVERLKKQPLGDLILEEDLFDIVKQAIPKTFFEQRTIPGSGYNSSTTKEPLIVEVMRQVLEPQVKLAVTEWVSDNQQMIMDSWKNVFDAGLFEYVQRIQSEQANVHIRKALGHMIDQLNQERSKHGLGQLYI